MIVDFVRADDWIIVYKDGVQIHSGHDVPFWLVMELILCPAHQVRDWWVEGEEIMDLGERENFDCGQPIRMTLETRLTLEAIDLEGA